MVRKTFSAILLALVFTWAPLPAQETPPVEEPAAVAEIPSDEDIFAPFPLRIRVGTQDEGIVLTWEDGADTVGNYAVYRSPEPINRDSFPLAVRVAVLPYGTHEYLDVPDSPDPYYYAVLGLAQDGSVYEVFIPLKNVSIAPVAFAAAKVPEPASVAVDERPAEAPPAVNVESVRDGIRISWTPVHEGRRIVIYRSPSPIRTLSDLLTASWTISAAESPDGLMDYPVPGIDYYYALVDDESLRTGNPVLVEGKNVTTKAVSVPAGVYRVGLPEIPYASRSLPLPFLALTKGVESGAFALPENLSVPAPARLAPETEKALTLVLRHGTARSPARPKLVIFPEDQEDASSGGEEYTLRIIVKQRLGGQEWETAADELARYLSLNRSPAVAARAHFYRGQAMAFSGLYRDAFFEFLIAQDYYYAESNVWMDWLLDQFPKS